MGAKNSTPAVTTVNTLQTESQTLEKGVETLQTSFQELSSQFFPRDEIEERFNKVHEDQNTNNEKLSQLIDLGTEQQQVITDLGNKYAQLYEDYCKQQKMFVDMTGKYEDKFQRYEDNLREARAKLVELEKEIMSSSEITQVLGIRRSDNMIKKEKINLRSQTKKTPEQPKPSQIETRSKGKERNAREKKYKDIPSVSNPEVLTKFDSADETSFLGTTTITQKADKETLLELNNTL